MGRYATREDEIDRLLRAGVFVDLYGITKQSLRASVETYSLKDLEVFFGFERKTDLRDARTSLRTLESALELNEVDTVSPSVRATVFSITSQADAIGQWTGGPAIGAIGNAFGIRAALVLGASLLSPAVALYARTVRRDGGGLAQPVEAGA